VSRIAYACGMAYRTWVVVSAAVALATTGGCADGSPAGESGETSGASSGSSSSGDPSSTDETGEPMECPLGTGAMLEWSVVGPQAGGEDGENSELDREATCSVVATGGSAAAGWTLDLSCDEVAGALAQPYALTFTMAESPFVSVASDRPVELHYQRWSYFEVGPGARLSLTQDGEPMLVASAESAGGGVVGHCAMLDDPLRQGANEFLALFGSSVEPAGCADPAVFRIARLIDEDDVYAYPGELTDLGDDVRALVEASRCAVDAASNAEDWTLELAIWAD